MGQSFLKIGMATVKDSNVNPQADSPFFGLIPAEIRNQIFQLALSADYDYTKPYTPYSFYFRPGFCYAEKIHLDLLLTCRRIYFETRYLPLIINVHTEWFYRAPLRSSRKFMNTVNVRGTNVQRTTNEKSLTEDQKSAIRSVHLFTQQYWLEDAWHNYFGWSYFTERWSALTQIRITIRHTDWWNWESNAPLAMDAKRLGRARPNDWVGISNPFEPGSWGHAFRNFRAIKIFELELETIERKKDELDKIVKQASTWHFVLGNGSIMCIDDSKMTRTGWVGSKYFTGKPEPPAPNVRQHRRDDFSQPDENPAQSRLAKVGVKFDNLPELGCNLAPTERLTYYVVKLRWHVLAESTEVMQG